MSKFGTHLGCLVLITILGQGCSDFGSQGTAQLGSDKPQAQADANKIPDMILTSKPAAVTAMSAAIFGFGSTDSTASFWCSLNGATPKVCFNPVNYNITITGNHTFSIYSVSKEGMQSDPISHTWNYNPNSISVQISTTLATFTKLQNLSISFNGSYSLGVSGFECRLDSSVEYLPCTSPRAVTVSEGAHQFFVRAIGADGTRSAPATVSWTTDLSMPTANVIGETIPNTMGYYLKYTLTSSDPSGIKSRKCQFKGGPIFDCSTSFEIQTGVASTPEVFNFWVEDNAGNIRQVISSFYNGTFS